MFLAGILGILTQIFISRKLGPSADYGIFLFFWAFPSFILGTLNEIYNISSIDDKVQIKPKNEGNFLSFQNAAPTIVICLLYLFTLLGQGLFLYLEKNSDAYLKFWSLPAIIIFILIVGSLNSKTYTRLNLSGNFLITGFLILVNAAIYLILIISSTSPNNILSIPISFLLSNIFTLIISKPFCANVQPKNIYLSYQYILSTHTLKSITTVIPNAIIPLALYIIATKFYDASEVVYLGIGISFIGFMANTIGGGFFVTKLFTKPQSVRSITSAKKEEIGEAIYIIPLCIFLMNSIGDIVKLIYGGSRFNTEQVAILSETALFFLPIGALIFAMNQLRAGVYGGSKQCSLYSSSIKYIVATTVMAMVMSMLLGLKGLGLGWILSSTYFIWRLYKFQSHENGLSLTRHDGMLIASHFAFSILAASATTFVVRTIFPGVTELLVIILKMIVFSALIISSMKLFYKLMSLVVKS